MADLSGVSDADLQALAAGDMKSVSDEGLAHLAALPNEIAPAAPLPSQSPVAAATTGLAQGATMGWAPAIGAAGKTAMDALTGVSGPLGGGSLDDLVDEYRRNRDQLRGDFAKAAAAHPHIALAGQLAGGAASLGLAGPAAMTTEGLAATGAATGLGGTDINSTEDIPTAAKNAAMGAGANLIGGTIAQEAAPVIGKALAPIGNAVSSGLERVGQAFGNTAEDLALKATGATGAQASKFAEGAGRELLDQGAVNFGSSPANIAENTQGVLDAAEASKSGIVSELPDTTVDRNTVYNYIRQKIQALAGDESQVGVVKNLESKLEDIAGAADQTGSEIPLAQAEKIRKGFDQNAKWNSNSDAPTLEANKIAANAYREAAENAITEADPTLGAQYKAAKTTQSKLIGPHESAEKRALTLNQSPFGGLLDMASVGGGGTIGTMIGGPVGTVVGGAAGLATKALRPRFASMAAVSADRLSDILKATPAAFGKFAPVLSAAVARGGPVSLSATDYVLAQTSQEYRDQKNQLFGSGERQPAEQSAQ